MSQLRSDDCYAGLAPRVHTLRTPAMRLQYLEWGEAGPPFVLWHGITSSARGWWRVGPALAELGYHVYAPDLPGHGESDNSPDGYAVDVTAALLDGWMAELGLGSPIVAGHSWGGMNAIMHAGSRATRVRGRAYLFLDPALRISEDPSSRVPLYLVGLGTPDDAASRSALAAQNPRWHPCDALWKSQARFLSRPEAVRGFFQANAGRDVISMLEQLDLPALLMLADPDKGGLLPADAIPSVAQRLPPNVSLRVIDGSSHNIHRDSFAPFMAAIEEFLPALDSPRSTHSRS